MRILGIETSADETSAAIVEDGNKMLSLEIASSIDVTKIYGGIVPEIVARSHLEVITPVIEQAFKDAELGWNDVDGIAVTRGPGLGGSLLVGVLTARTLAIAKQKPLYGVDHVLAHIYAAFIEDLPKFPLLALIVSGGHTQLVLMKSHSSYRLLGQTTDDAIGEAFDKVAKILGLPYPGGPSIAAAATDGDATAFKLPVAKVLGQYDFSFSGLKTAVLRVAQSAVDRDFTLLSAELPGLLSEQQKADIAASFQSTAIKTVVNKLKQACSEFSPDSVVICGGVAANHLLRSTATEVLPVKTSLPDFKLCTDNAAMIAACAHYHQKASLAEPLTLDIDPSLSMAAV